MASEKNFVIMMMGYTCSGKSTIAKMLAEKIKADIYHSALVRKEMGYKFTKDEARSDFFLMTSKEREPMDKAVYRVLAERVRISLVNGRNVIIDAGHFFAWQRKNIYKNVAEFNPDLIILLTKCPEEEIFRRLKKREEEFFDSEFNETPSVRAYHSSKEAMEFPNNDFFNGMAPIIIKYNTHTKSINIKKSVKNKNMYRIIKALK